MTLENLGHARTSGDINLIATMMALGIPLDPVCPVSLIDRDGMAYSTYHVCEYSADGIESSDEVSEFWAGLKASPANHGYRHISEFIRSRPRGIQRSSDLLDFAVDYLTGRGHRLPGIRSLGDIPDFVAALPNDEASYVLAYVWNREVCYQLHKLATRKVFYEDGEGDDTRRAIIDTRLPKWKAKEILARLEG
jgi:hypothetical protein